MKQGFLSYYFSGVGAKKLAEVEIPNQGSRQHEFNGIQNLKEIFGTERIEFRTKFIYFHDDENERLVDFGKLTWYDSRKKKAEKRSAEFRLYYPSNLVLDKAEKGDLVVICKKSDEEAIVIIAPENSTSEKQLLWLFSLTVTTEKAVVKDLTVKNIALTFSNKYILNELGVEVEEIATNYHDELIGMFGNNFPSTDVFSKYARSTMPNVSPVEFPDETIIGWMNREELLFKTLEKHFVQKRLQEGFGTNGEDVDSFMNFSLSVQNRRKSRAGHAFERHLAYLFEQNKINFSKGASTERKNKPDFIFPDIRSYKDPSFPEIRLTMLGVKTTAKDRWRQVLSEADRIKVKHLVTLQPAISKNQTDEMQTQKVQLVLPSAVLETYSPQQKPTLMNIGDFIKLVREKQDKMILRNG